MLCLNVENCLNYYSQPSTTDSELENQIRSRLMEEAKNNMGRVDKLFVTLQKIFINRDLITVFKFETGTIQKDLDTAILLALFKVFYFIYVASFLSQIYN